jgi:hypothetical protein
MEVVAKKGSWYSYKDIRYANSYRRIFIMACEYIRKKLPCTSYPFMPFGMKGNPTTTNISDSPPFHVNLWCIPLWNEVECKCSGSIPGEWVGSFPMFVWS